MNENWPHHLEQALRTHLFKQIDRQTTSCADGEIVIVDEFTGRLMERPPVVRRPAPGGRGQGEGCPIQPEIADPTRRSRYQNLFRMYDKLSGMTGTAADRGCRVRRDLRPRRGRDPHQQVRMRAQGVPRGRGLPQPRTSKYYAAVVADILRCAPSVGSPVLVGTTSVEKSALVAQPAHQADGVPHEVLNAKQHEREAHHHRARPASIGAVTISTNMAGSRHRHQAGPVRNFPELLEHWKKGGFAPKDARPDQPDLFDRLTDHWVEQFLDEKQQAKLKGSDNGAKRKPLEAYWKANSMTPFPESPVKVAGRARRAAHRRHRAARVPSRRQPAPRSFGSSGRPGQSSRLSTWRSTTPSCACSGRDRITNLDGADGACRRTRPSR